MSDIAAEVQKWKPLIEALGYRCLTGTDEDATVLTIMSGEQVVGCASLHSDGELSHYVDAKKIASALSTAREEGRREGLEEAAKHLDEVAVLSSVHTTQTYYRAASAAIRALKEKQP